VNHVDRVLGNELIRVVGTDRNGGRPERTVSAVTDAGRVDPMERVRRSHDLQASSQAIATALTVERLPRASRRAQRR
jgi:hypothetical protein